MDEEYAEMLYEILKIAYALFFLYYVGQAIILLFFVVCDACAAACNGAVRPVNVVHGRVTIVRHWWLGSTDETAKINNNNNINNNNTNNNIINTNNNNNDDDDDDNDNDNNNTNNNINNYNYYDGIRMRLKEAETRGAQLMVKYIEAEAKAVTARAELESTRIALDAAETIIGMMACKCDANQTNINAIPDNIELGISRGDDLSAAQDDMSVTEAVSSTTLNQTTTAMQECARGKEQEQKSKLERLLGMIAFVLLLIFGGILLLLVTSGGAFGRILNAARRKNRVAVDTVRALLCKMYTPVSEAGRTIIRVSACANIERFSVVLWPLTRLVQNPGVPRKLNALHERVQSIAWLYRAQDKEIRRRVAEAKRLAGELQGVASWNLRFCSPEVTRGTKWALVDAAHRTWASKASIDAKLDVMKEMWTIREHSVCTVFEDGQSEFKRLKSEVLRLHNEANAVEVELAVAEREVRGLEGTLERSSTSQKNQIVGVMHFMHALLTIGSTAPPSWRDTTTTSTAGLVMMMQLFYREVRGTCSLALGRQSGLQVFPRSATAPFSRAASTTRNGLIDFGHWKLGIKVTMASTAFPAVFAGDMSLWRAHSLVESHLYDWIRGIVHPSSRSWTRTGAPSVGSGSTCLSVSMERHSTPAVAFLPASPMDWSPTPSLEYTILPSALERDSDEGKSTAVYREEPQLARDDSTLREFVLEFLSVWALNVRVAMTFAKVLDNAMLSNQMEFAQSCVAATTLREFLSVWALNARVAKANRKVLDNAIMSNQMEFAQSYRPSPLQVRLEEGRLQLMAKCFSDARRLRRSLVAWRFSLFASTMSDSDGQSCASGISSKMSTPLRNDTAEASSSSSSCPSSSSRPSTSASPSSFGIENAASKKAKRGSAFKKGKRRISSPKFSRFALRSLDINVG